MDQPDLNILLAKPAPLMFSEEDAEALRGLIAKGAIAGAVIETDDCRRAYEDLIAKGVTFLQEPAERPYGIEALLRDDSGNWFNLTQRSVMAERTVDAYVAALPPTSVRRPITAKPDQGGSAEGEGIHQLGAAGGPISSTGTDAWRPLH